LIFNQLRELFGRSSVFLDLPELFETIKPDKSVKSLKLCHAREGGHQEVTENTG